MRITFVGSVVALYWAIVIVMVVLAVEAPKYAPLAIHAYELTFAAAVLLVLGVVRIWWRVGGRLVGDLTGISR